MRKPWCIGVTRYKSLKKPSSVIQAAFKEDNLSIQEDNLSLLDPRENKQTKSDNQGSTTQTEFLVSDMFSSGYTPKFP